MRVPKLSVFLHIAWGTCVSFNVSLANDDVSFDQLGPGITDLGCLKFGQSSLLLQCLLMEY